MKFAGGDEVENADVFSLVNIMTVEHIATRPSPTRSFISISFFLSEKPHLEIG